MGALSTLKAMPNALRGSHSLADFIKRKRTVHLRHMPPNTMGDEEFKKLFHNVDTTEEGGRLETYENWPAESRVSVSDLAAAGFCYAGEGDSDKVVCFSCKGEISQWKEFEVPIRMHCEAYPTCEFAKGVARETAAKRSGVVFDAKAEPETARSAPFADEENPSSGTSLTTAEAIYFGSEFNRLLTLCDWSLLNPVDRYDLAASGFVRPDEKKELTVCVACGLEVKEWVLGDLPQKKHAELRPDCPFVKDRASSGRAMDNSEKYQFVKQGVASDK